MTPTNTRVSLRLSLLAGAACVTLAGCQQPLDLDMRGIGGGFTTANAAQAPLAARPLPDDRGVISYPNYQVAVARRGDTLADVAARVGLNAATLAKYNGIDPARPQRPVSRRRRWPPQPLLLPSQRPKPAESRSATKSNAEKPPLRWHASIMYRRRIWPNGTASAQISRSGKVNSC